MPSLSKNTSDDPKVRQPDIIRAQAMLDREPKVPLEEGLQRTIKYFAAFSGLHQRRLHRQ